MKKFPEAHISIGNDNSILKIITKHYNNDLEDI